MTAHVHEPARETPITHRADLVVAGGGTAGVACAVCAARLGLSVVMVENSAIPGGMVTHVTHWTNDFDNKGGFAREFIDGLIADGSYQKPYYNRFRVIPFFDRLIRDAGVRHLYLSRVVAPIMEGNRLTGVIVESKQGRIAVAADFVVDATGDGDVAALAGADYRVGREQDGAVQAATITQCLHGFTHDRVDLQHELLPMLNAIDPEYELPYDHGAIMRAPGTKATLLLGNAHAAPYDPLSAEGLSDALVEMRRQATELYDLMKQTELGRDLEYGPFSAIPGVRESRRITCDATITADDVRTGRRFDDGLFTVTQSIDIHRCQAGEPAIYVERVKPYHVPYRALLPKGLENLLVVGRCIGGDHEALASYRIIADCFAMGEAAAIAVSMAKEAACGLREIPVGDLAGEMSRLGYVR